jgi:hypothetical protein
MRMKILNLLDIDKLLTRLTIKLSRCEPQLRGVCAVSLRLRSIFLGVGAAVRTHLVVRPFPHSTPDPC